ncbi:two component transcriptional regulator, LuxR family [Ferrimonas balearica DSM 9799]|uniref:Two component transcriptional regulator, LuxR family n=1 Tax=Ferrimonas balearica (strain DSM 9799 / CCM 4581 / KCTC 23876 / PAT) TaxID=550540 RepID=E1STY6_FERBD|nr:response regulator transcription factor [Ferrimonas balearica]ADN77230.1 two component transcriptional regulator, LuxR family [Ferrimonas balearica DSM 9799]
MYQPDCILIADDHPLYRAALADLLRRYYPDCALAEADGAEPLNQALRTGPEPDLLLLDLHIPGAKGFQTLLQIREQYPALPVVVISGQEDDATVAQARQCGAAGFVPKSRPVEAMLDAVAAVLDGAQWWPQSAEGGELDEMAVRIASLSPRQHRILMLFAEGLLNKQIATRLGLSEATVKAHASAIFLKLGVRTRTQAVIALQSLQPERSLDSAT